MKPINFLDTVTCKMTNRNGVVYGIAEYLHESTQLLVLWNGENEPKWVSVGVVSVNQNTPE